MNDGSAVLWTVGHSNQPFEAFAESLSAHGVELIVDVRRFPGSRRLPQFTSPAFEAALASHGIAYRWIPALGGRRRPDPDSSNDAWKHPAFRAYADHMETEEFAEGLFELLMLANGLHSAIMCAEVLWWRCHRRLIADVLLVLGHAVRHIRGAIVEEHRLVGPARLVDGRLSYEAVADA